MWNRKDLKARGKAAFKAKQDLSFILWGILSAVTLGIAGIFYVGPYIQATNAELYNVLKNQ